MAWTETTEEQYHDMLDILPPALYSEHGFLVGEPVTHRPCRVTGDLSPTYDAFVYVRQKYYAAHESLTKAEFRAVTVAEVVAYPVPQEDGR